MRSPYFRRFLCFGGSEGKKYLTVLEFESSQITDEASISQAVENVVNTPQKNLLVVVSGMGQTERRLLEAGEKSASQDLVLASTLAEGIRTFHMQVARQLTSESTWSEAQSFLSELFEELSDLLKGMCLIGELSTQGGAILKSYAERASALIFAQALRERGVAAQALCARQIYLEKSTSATEGLQEKTRSDCSREISALSDQSTVPVVPSSLRPNTF